MARKQQKRHNRGSDRRKTAHAHRSTRHMQPVRTQKTVRRRLPEAEVRRRQRARRRQFALLGLAVLLIVLIFAFRHLISTPQQSGADGDTGNSGTSATEEVKQVAKAVNVYQSVMYYQPVVQKYAEQNGIPEYTDVLLAIMQVESGGKLTVYDREDDKDHELTLEKLLNGWKKYAEDHNADDFDEYDGISADCIMQYAIFGDVIYG